MARILLVYYSRTGITRLLAKDIARRSGCDIEEIREVRSRDGVAGYARSLIDVLSKRHPAIEAPNKNPASYDLVVAGTPVWGSDISSPLRSYLAGNRGKFKRIAAFCTMGGSGGGKALGQLALECEREPVATLVLTHDEVEGGMYGAKAQSFVDQFAAQCTDA
ncbi:MAG TPA: flavodoxin [Burkholderiaceae bacterium]